MIDVSKVQGASESSRATSRSVGQRTLEREAHVMVNALKNCMTIMIDTLLQQVAAQVRKPWRPRDL